MDLNGSAIDLLIPSIVTLQIVPNSKSNVYKIVKICAWVLRHHLGKTLMPNIEFMKSWSLHVIDQKKVIFCFTRILLLNPENMKDYARVEEIGYESLRFIGNSGFFII